LSNEYYGHSIDPLVHSSSDLQECKRIKIKDRDRGGRWDRGNVSLKISRTEAANVNVIDNTMSKTNGSTSLETKFGVAETHLEDFRNAIANNIIEVATAIVLTSEVMINEGLIFVTKLDEISDKRNIQKHIPGKNNCARWQSGTKSMASGSESSANKCVGISQQPN
jgi:hypothetical protein